MTIEVSGTIERKGKRWVFSYEEGDEDDEPVFRLGDHVFKPGEYIFAATSVDADGKITALRIQVSKDGVRPPQ